jgi:hypothetical protein
MKKYIKQSFLPRIADDRLSFTHNGQGDPRSEHPNKRRMTAKGEK